MPNDQLIAYIRERLSAGVAKDEIIKTLIATGWQVADINAGFAAIEAPARAPAPMPTPATTERRPLAATAFPASTIEEDPVLQAAFTAELPSRGHRWIIPAVITILVLMVIGAGGAYAYVTFFATSPTTSAPEAKPENAQPTNLPDLSATTTEMGTSTDMSDLSTTPSAEAASTTPLSTSTQPKAR